VSGAVVLFPDQIAPSPQANRAGVPGRGSGLVFVRFSTILLSDREPGKVLDGGMLDIRLY
jgi:hypothetical protein